MCFLLLLPGALALDVQLTATPDSLVYGEWATLEVVRPFDCQGCSIHIDTGDPTIRYRWTGERTMEVTLDADAEDSGQVWGDTGEGDIIGSKVGFWAHVVDPVSMDDGWDTADVTWWIDECHVRQDCVATTSDSDSDSSEPDCGCRSATPTATVVAWAALFLVATLRRARRSIHDTM